MRVIQRNNTKFVEAVSVRDFYDSFKEPLEMELVAGESGLDNMIKERSLNQPALAMVGFLKPLPQAYSAIRSWRDGFHQRKQKPIESPS